MSVTMRQMLEAGVHFGHQTRFWNPKMAPYIFGHRNKIHIVNLEQTLPRFQEACKFARQLAANRGTILMVGTKRQAREIVATEARRAGAPFVDQRWLGGMLTNFKTVKTSIKRLKDMKAQQEAGLESMSKKEQLMFQRELDKLEKDIGGIQDMAALPDALFVIDVGYHKIAVAEARRMEIPIVAIVDTNCDPDEVDYVIPGNDDAIRSVALLTRVIADAVAEGLVARHSGAAPGGTTADVEPLAEWERELLATEGAPSAGVATGGPEPDGSDSIVVERVTGRPFREVAIERVCAPVGMTRKGNDRSQKATA